MNILHFFSKTKDKITNENSNTSVNSELINDQSILNPCQTTLERTCKLEVKKKTQNIKKI